MSDQSGWAHNNALNWDDVPDGPPPALEGGVYGLRVAVAEPEATNDGAAGVRLELFAVCKFGDSENMKRKLYDKLAITAGAMFRMKNFAKCAEVELPSTDSADDVAAFCDRVIDANGLIWAFVKQQKDKRNPNEPPRNRVERYLTAEQAPIVDAQGLAALLPEGPAAAGGGDNTRRARRTRKGNK